MKIFDCFMYYDEDVVLDIRLNTLDKFVDYFVIVESEYFHNGKRRKLNFNINNYSKFKKKIIYLKHNLNSDKLEDILSKDSKSVKTMKSIHNAHKRENSQRNFIMQGLNFADDNDLIMVSDVDEIPNLENLNFRNINNKIILFKQKIFYYKLNRYLENFIWFGTKACKKKYLKNPQWLRNVKSKKYHFFRFDTFFSKLKYINKHYIDDGGWHFSNLKKSKDIELKLKSYLHHPDYESEELGKDKIESLIKQNKTIYNMYTDKRDSKFSDNTRSYLKKFEIKNLPTYVQKNKIRFNEWLD